MKKWLLFVLVASTLVLTWCGIKKKAVVLEDNMSKNLPQQETMVKTEDVAPTNTQNDTTMWTWTTGGMMKQEDTMQKEPAMEQTAVEQPAPAKGMYETYSSDAVKKYLASWKKVMLFFHAARCPSCRSLDKELTTQADKIPANSVVLKVNYDTEWELKKTYWVTSQHTLVYIDQNMKTLFKQSWWDIDSIASILK